MHPSFFIARFSALPCSSVVGISPRRIFSFRGVYFDHGMSRNYTESQVYKFSLPWRAEISTI
jgi:hypothetical protein